SSNTSNSSSSTSSNSSSKYLYLGLGIVSFFSLVYFSNKFNFNFLKKQEIPKTKPVVKEVTVKTPSVTKEKKCTIPLME
ncbi:hypothetical protein, partial [Bartonella sp. CL32QHWL-2]|uniref:hypothetical protein n=1 Tax=Bartonella sp. CL32QHWL-2 TaxID=3243525 RepID=UPI0035CEA581